MKWHSTVEKDRFVTSVDAISVAIVQRGFMYFSTNHTYRLDIFDQSGEMVESLGNQETTREQEAQMARLFVLAPRSALDVDSTLEKLAKGLEL